MPIATLGSLLDNRGDWDQAEAAERKAIQLNPGLYSAYVNLSAVLGKQQKYAEAEVELRNAVKLKDDDASVFNNLGLALLGQKKLAEAIAAIRKAIELEPKNAMRHYNLGVALHEQGSFAASLASLRQAKALSWRTAKSQLLMQDIEHYVVLDPKLPKMISGESSPAGAAERVFLAKLCQLPCRQLYASSVRFFSDAFALEPKLAGPQPATDVVTHPRHRAACAAALAGCGQGKDAGHLKPEEYVRLRAQALAWLRADLTTGANGSINSHSGRAARC